jgi:Protein of unknown function (DUF3263)
MGVLVSSLVVGQAVPMALTEREIAIIDFERTWWTLDGTREDMIRDRFECTPEELGLELGALVDSAEAMAHDPLVVRRLRRQRDRRRRALVEGAAQ